MTDRLIERVRSAVTGLGPGPIVVAGSGGLDSCVLLHLLRFEVTAPDRLVVAHFDHGMRPGSEADAAWLSGVSRAWGVRVVVERAADPPTSEDEARTLRYRFLHRTASAHEASAVMTAHHADDQAETVLFRILRGTGLDGLQGIPDSRAPGIVRPLLDVWRSQLEAYATDRGVRWRDDPTNADLGPARNVLRHVILPAAEESVASGARRSLVRLASIAEENEAAWREVLPDIVATLAPSPIGTGPLPTSFDRDAVLALGEPLRARVIRWLAARSGSSLDAAATLRAVTFTQNGRSGKSVDLGGGLVLRRDLGRFAIGRRSDPASVTPLVIRDRTPGAGRSSIGGSGRALRWGVYDAAAGRRRDLREAAFSLDDLVFPLVVRGWEPGDRIRTDGGTKKLKKLFLEERVAEPDRHRTMVVADGTGRVLWVPGVARAADVRTGSFRIRVDP